jgi:hypothetical protein
MEGAAMMGMVTFEDLEGVKHELVLRDDGTWVSATLPDYAETLTIVFRAYYDNGPYDFPRGHRHIKVVAQRMKGQAILVPPKPETESTTHWLY